MSTENTITTAAADVAAAPNATLDELVGTTTNTAILPEPDAHAYDEIATGDADPLILGGHKFTSRFILASGRYDRGHADRHHGAAPLPHHRKQPARLHSEGHHHAAEHVGRAQRG